MLPAYIVYALLGLNETLLKNNKLKVYANVRNYEKAKDKFSLFLNRDDFELIVKDVVEFIDFNKHIDIVIHAASQASPKYYGIDPVGTLKANTIGTMNMLELAKKNNCERFLFISFLFLILIAMYFLLSKKRGITAFFGTLYLEKRK